jgi:hypothetical protein
MGGDGMTERCEACNHETDMPHTITVVLNADADWGTELTAYFCADHCPGNCDLGCGPRHGSTQVAR